MTRTQARAVARQKIDELHRSMDQGRTAEPRRDVKSVFVREGHDRRSSPDKGAEAGRPSKSPSSDDLARAENEGMVAPQKN